MPEIPEYLSSSDEGIGNNNEVDAPGRPARRDSARHDEGSACQSCRKRKTRCTRESPCSQCHQLGIECVYRGRNKPGLRRGAVEGLSQRLGKLENMFLGQSVLWKHVLSALSSLQGQSTSAIDLPLSGNLDDCIDNFSEALLRLSAEQKGSGSNGVERPAKRRRTDNGSNAINLNEDSLDSIQKMRNGSCLPPPDLVDHLVELYFRNIQPWIPVIHPRSFRERRQRKERGLDTMLHAIVSVTVRLSDDPRLSQPEVRKHYERVNREKVILSSMESFSVENIEALIIIAFNIIGSGRGPSAWSMVGSMSRTVEQLQLNIEADSPNYADVAHYLLERLSFLTPAEDWIQEEERRRVFWNVFLMDRFCSIATGWNVSFSSSDIQRRLPCHGPLWLDGQQPPLPTPYFGTTGKQMSPDLDIQNGNSEAQKHPSIGGLAYRVEATENLSLVTMFFLKHAVNVANIHSLQMWMMRFKELDLRLTQWKMFLPQKWREASVFNEDGSMDQNLSLAHIVHNTAVILLHQAIAYPSHQWKETPVHLPSRSSAESCYAAAIEVSIIATKYLQYSSGLVAPEFAFCLFISGRLLLSHVTYYGVPLPEHLDHLVGSLQEISRRWNGLEPNSNQPAEDLASKFAARLDHARKVGASAANQVPSLDLRQTAYSEREHGRQHTVGPPRAVHFEPSLDQSFGEKPEDQTGAYSLAFPPLPPAFQSGWNASSVGSSTETPGIALPVATPSFTGGQPFPSLPEGGPDISSFFDEPFTPMQRISTFLPHDFIGRSPADS